MSPSAATPTLTPVAASSNGFDWGDAAIGAGVALIVMLGIGGIATGARRTRQGLPA